MDTIFHKVDLNDDCYVYIWILQSEIMNLRSSDKAKPEGTVIESRVDKGLGVVVTSIVQKGTLKIGDIVLAGPSWGRVRRLISDQGEDLKEAGPSTPVQVRIV